MPIKCAWPLRRTRIRSELGTLIALRERELGRAMKLLDAKMISADDFKKMADALDSLKALSGAMEIELAACGLAFVALSRERPSDISNLSQPVRGSVRRSRSAPSGVSAYPER